MNDKMRELFEIEYLEVNKDACLVHHPDYPETYAAHSVHCAWLTVQEIVKSLTPTPILLADKKPEYGIVGKFWVSFDGITWDTDVWVYEKWQREMIYKYYAHIVYPVLGE